MGGRLPSRHYRKAALLMFVRLLVSLLDKKFELHESVGNHSAVAAMPHYPPPAPKRHRQNGVETTICNEIGSSSTKISEIGVAKPRRLVVRKPPVNDHLVQEAADAANEDKEERKDEIPQPSTLHQHNSKECPRLLRFCVAGGSMLQALPDNV